MFIGSSCGLKLGLCSVLEDPAKPSKLTVKSVIKVTSCFVLYVMPVQIFSSTNMNKSSRHVKVLNNGNTHELIVTSHGERYKTRSYDFHTFLSLQWVCLF